MIEGKPAMSDDSPQAVNLEDRTPEQPQRWRTVVLVVLALLPLVLTAAAQPFLPETVPVHYGLNGPNDWGPKGEMFVAAGLVSAAGFLIAGLFAVFEHQRATGREDWIIFNDSSFGMSFPLCIVMLVVLAVIQGAIVAAAFGIAGFVPPENIARLIVDVVCGLCVLAMWGFAAYMLVTGKSLLTFRSEPTSLERQTGDDKRQARAVGVLVLFLSVFVIVEWALIR